MHSLVMRGDTLDVGGVLCIKHIKNPCQAARLVLNNSHHCLLSGNAAYNMATRVGILLATVLITLVLGVGGGGHADTSATAWLIVDDLGLFLHRHGDDLWRQVQVLAEVLDALVGQHPVVVAPRELLLDQTARCQ